MDCESAKKTNKDADNRLWLMQNIKTFRKRAEVKQKKLWQQKLQSTDLTIQATMKTQKTELTAK